MIESRDLVQVHAQGMDSDRIEIFFAADEVDGPLVVRNRRMRCQGDRRRRGLQLEEVSQLSLTRGWGTVVIAVRYIAAIRLFLYFPGRVHIVGLRLLIVLHDGEQVVSRIVAADGFLATAAD